jgi:hypothetical protein
MMSAMTTVARIWSARARSGRPPSRPQTMLTVLTQTPPFISGNRACEPGFTGVGARSAIALSSFDGTIFAEPGSLRSERPLATFPNLPGRNDFVFVPALAGALAVRRRRPSRSLSPYGHFRRTGVGQDRPIEDATSARRPPRAVGAAWSSTMSRAALRSAVPVGGTLGRSEARNVVEAPAAHTRAADAESIAYGRELRGLSANAESRWRTPTAATPPSAARLNSPRRRRAFGSRRDRPPPCCSGRRRCRC